MFLVSVTLIDGFGLAIQSLLGIGIPHLSSEENISLIGISRVATIFKIIKSTARCIDMFAGQQSQCAAGVRYFCYNVWRFHKSFSFCLLHAVSGAGWDIYCAQQ